MGLPAAAPRPAPALPIDERFAEGLESLGVTISASAQGQLRAYLALLAKWNGVYNLTSIRDVRDMLPVHLLDSLAILPLIDESAASMVLDVGSGAGLPGIPLAIARPRLAVTTVDAVAKKVSFQQQAKAQLGLRNLTAIHARVEALALAENPSLIVSRAYASIPDMLTAVCHLAGTTTRVIAMKGAPPNAEIAALPDDWTVRELRDLHVPFLGARRCAVVLVRKPST